MDPEECVNFKIHKVMVKSIYFVMEKKEVLPITKNIKI